MDQWHSRRSLYPVFKPDTYVFAFCIFSCQFWSDYQGGACLWHFIIIITERPTPAIHKFILSLSLSLSESANMHIFELWSTRISRSHSFCNRIFHHFQDVDYAVHAFDMVHPLYCLLRRSLLSLTSLADPSTPVSSTHFLSFSNAMLTTLESRCLFPHEHRSTGFMCHPNSMWLIFSRLHSMSNAGLTF